MRHETFETPGPLRIRVESASGSIELETVDGAMTEVELKGCLDDVKEARVELRERGDGHELVVETHPRGGFRLFRLNSKGIDVRIRAPHGASVEISSASADVEGRGRYGKVDVNSASGDVTFEEIKARRRRTPRQATSRSAASAGTARSGRPPATSRSAQPAAPSRCRPPRGSGDRQRRLWRSDLADGLG